MDIKEAMVRPPGLARHPWEEARWQVVSYLLKHSVPGWPCACARALDVGCGDGYVVMKLAAKFPHIAFLAVDPALPDTVLTNLRSRAPANLTFEKEMDDSRRPDQPTSLVLLLDVIEHVENDVAFLRNLVRSPLLQHQAFFLITVPAFRRLYSSHDRILGHYRRYSRSDLLHCLRIANLECIDSGYLFLAAAFVRALQVIAERLHFTQPRQQTIVTQWHKSSGVTSLLARLLFAECLLSRGLQRCGVRVPGLTCYAICQTR